MEKPVILIKIRKNDLVFDYDEIQSVLTLQPKHLDNKEVKPYITEIMKNMIKRAKKDNQIETFWIIRTVPDEAFKKLFEGSNVEYYYINKNVFECLEQIQHDKERIESDKNWYALLMNLQNEFMQGVYQDCIFVNE